MKLIFAGIFVLCISIDHGWSQNSNNRFSIGSYFSFISDEVLHSTTLDTFRLNQFYINLNSKYSLSRRFSLGAEVLIVYMSPDFTDDPFGIAGVTLDYNVLNIEKSKLNLRVGASIGNLSFAGDVEPKKQTTVNRVIGISYEFNICKNLWIYTGYYNHFALNRIQYKYSIAQPFVGVRFEL